MAKYQGGAAWLTAEEESDRISMKKKLHKEYIAIISESMFVRLLH